MVWHAARLAGGLAVLALGCGTGRDAARESAEAAPGSLADGAWQAAPAVAQAVARESPDLQVYEVVLPDVQERPTVRLRSCREPVRLSASREGVSHVRVCLAEHVEADCVVRSDRVDLAHGFQRAHQQVTRGTGTPRQHVGPLQLLPEARWPGLALRMEYLTERGQYGALHVAASNVRDHGVFCTVDAPGYVRTFQGMVEDLVASLAESLEESAARRAFYAVVVGGQTVGLTEMVGRDRADGTHVDMTFAALLAPEQERLDVRDEVEVEISEATGPTVLLRVMRQVNGDMQRDLVLGPLSTSRRLSARGKWDGEERVLELGSQVPTSARQLRAHLTRSVADARPAPRRFLRYFPGLDVETLAEETVQLLMPLEEGGRFHSVLRTPGATVEAEYDVDAQGELVRTVLTGGKGVVVLERLPRS